MSELSAVHMTAFGAAAARARHMNLEGEPKILNDPFAQKLLGWSDHQVALLTAPMAQRPYGAALWAMRSRFTEDRLATAITDGVSQYVVLGAGLDTFALRNENARESLTVFEVDAPPLQRWKQERMRELGIAVPERLRFAPCDFESMALASALAGAGFDAHRAAVVSWLAVTQYLTRAAIDETLRWAASLAKGSEIVLTYVVPGEEAEAEKAMLAARGVQFSTFFTPEEMEAALLGAGLREVEHLTPEDAQRVYFDGRSDGLVAPQLERLVVAKSGA
jgi:methyltransferase (TIGR00027 family)